MDSSVVENTLRDFFKSYLQEQEGFLEEHYETRDEHGFEAFDYDEDETTVIAFDFATLDGDALNLGFLGAQQLDPNGPTVRYFADRCLAAAREAHPAVFAGLSEVRLRRRRAPWELMLEEPEREVMTLFGQSAGISLDHWVGVGVRYDAEDGGYRPGQGDTWVVECRSGAVSAFCLGTRWVTAAWGDAESGFATLADGAVLVRDASGAWSEQVVGGTVVGVTGDNRVWCWGLEGDGGFVAQYTAEGWKKRSVPFAVNSLIDSEAGVFVGGHDGALAQLDGEQWRLLSSPTRASVLGLAWHEHRLYAVTTGNEVVGGPLEQLQVLCRSDGQLNAVHAQGGSVWVGGEFGVVGLCRLVEDRLEQVGRGMAVLRLSGTDELVIGGMGNVRVPGATEGEFRAAGLEAFRAIAAKTEPAWGE